MVGRVSIPGRNAFFGSEGQTAGGAGVITQIWNLEQPDPLSAELAADRYRIYVGGRITNLVSSVIHPSY